MESDAVVTIVVLILLLIALGGAVAYLLFDKHKSDKDLKTARRKLRDAKRDLAEYRTAAAAAAKQRTRVGMTYDANATRDPHMKQLFEALQELVDHYQGEGCKTVLAHMDQAVKEVTKTFKSDIVPCSSMKEGIVASLKEEDIVLPAEVMRTVDKILSIVMDAICDGSGNIDGRALAKFLKALTESLCG